MGPELASAHRPLGSTSSHGLARSVNGPAAFAHGGVVSVLCLGCAWPVDTVLSTGAGTSTAAPVEALASAFGSIFADGSDAFFSCLDMDFIMS